MVKDFKISPSEAWGMDFREIRFLVDLGDEEKEPAPDLSLMLAFERKSNGCPQELLN